MFRRIRWWWRERVYDLKRWLGFGRKGYMPQHTFRAYEDIEVPSLERNLLPRERDAEPPLPNLTIDRVEEY